ncbi:hypothetical protein [Maribacter stanieri]|uniref:Uncharacterized protein n=1 Tax=Maribacter stanieri TaxID=440514 RepID=A0A1I6IEN3_9FLAO|nr:hypothetical protein [Maribacter stanieri]SFR65151.1 hypothetical protein SAMN04488010_1577 [Maribacter stanieri]
MIGYITKRHGGLFLNGIQILQDKVDNYDKVLEEVKQRQLSKQNLLTASEIFVKIETRLKEVSVICEQGEGKKCGVDMAVAILKEFDNEGIYISTNHRRLLIFPRIDKNETMTLEFLGGIWQNFINAINPKIENSSTTYSGINGAELYQIFLIYLTMN